ncbi:hypothetical protein EDD18DRAFT_1108861 [Armillaria luteobubalina]|uniref:Uncharacterized protein n=1 Tax=Armillaria luteobubalina TaxID=153913 RepID=A0AA39PZ95_9AGAR|nr:hypothetical protein EDD18DRAFT_1108861 [Armillaria luteobubalina]
MPQSSSSEESTSERAGITADPFLYTHQNHINLSIAAIRRSVTGFERANGRSEVLIMVLAPDIYTDLPYRMGYCTAEAAILLAQSPRRECTILLVTSLLVQMPTASTRIHPTRGTLVESVAEAEDEIERVWAQGYGPSKTPPSLTIELTRAYIPSTGHAMSVDIVGYRPHFQQECQGKEVCCDVLEDLNVSNGGFAEPSRECNKFRTDKSNFIFAVAPNEDDDDVADHLKGVQSGSIDLGAACIGKSRHGTRTAPFLDMGYVITASRIPFHHAHSAKTAHNIFIFLNTKEFTRRPGSPTSRYGSEPAGDKGGWMIRACPRCPKLELFAIIFPVTTNAPTTKATWLCYTFHFFPTKSQVKSWGYVVQMRPVPCRIYSEGYEGTVWLGTQSKDSTSPPSRVHFP